MTTHLPYARVIVNPTAGAGATARKWPRVKTLLKHLGMRFEHDLTEAPGHAIELARSAVKQGYELVVSVGGDGTVNEVVNGLYDNKDTKNAMLGIISTGTGSDYIRTLGIPRTFEEACQHLMNPRKLTVDLGVVECTSQGQKVRRLFVNFAGLGFDAEIVKATTQKFKVFGSMPAYLMGLFTTLLLYRNRKISLRLDGGVEQEMGMVCAMTMCNGKYGGGGMLLAPDADPTDGLMDILMIGDLSKPDLLWSLPRIYKGTHLTHPKVTMKRAREVEIQCRPPMLVQADGELVGETPASCLVLPAALDVVV
jgi:YegS/Rv2252/BmrU family lipid kinase